MTITATSGASYVLKSLTITDASGKSISYNGNQNGTFTFTMPSNNVTVSAQFEKHFQNSFVDVANTAYYYDAVLWAVSRGITNGTSATTFGPVTPCSRAHIVTFLYRYLNQ